MIEWHRVAVLTALIVSIPLASQARPLRSRGDGHIPCPQFLSEAAGPAHSQHVDWAARQVVRRVPASLERLKARVGSKQVIELLLIEQCRKSPYLTLDTATLFVGSAVEGGSKGQSAFPSRSQSPLLD